MSLARAALVVGLTYAALLLAWLATTPFARRAFSRQPVVLVASTPTGGISTPSLSRSLGVLVVFLANIATMILVLLSPFSVRAEAILVSARLQLPDEVNIAGAIIFVLSGVWGALVLTVNPSYTPFFCRRGPTLRIATKGPYAIVRHPRYAIEATVNLALFFLTGVWFPLLGLLGWPALRQQAVTEEEYLMRVAPDKYGPYMASTGRFFPKLTRRRKD